MTLCILINPTYERFGSGWGVHIWDIVQQHRHSTRTGPHNSTATRQETQRQTHGTSHSHLQYHLRAIHNYVVSWSKSFKLLSNCSEQYQTIPIMPHSSTDVIRYNTWNHVMLWCRHDVELLVKGATGGLWKFPLRFIATEPEADDGIIIEATGLGKESSVGFRLNSQTK